MQEKNRSEPLYWQGKTNAADSLGFEDLKVSAPAYDLVLLGSDPTGQRVPSLQQSLLEHIQAQDELSVGVGGTLQ